MLGTKPYTFYFITGSQSLYGSATLEQAREHVQKMVDGLNVDDSLPFFIEFKPLVTTPAEIREVCLAANVDKMCAMSRWNRSWIGQKW
ncbi:L-arabinose isomerase [Peptococcaceae bacterium CEB3]|nr:L-arabinose isomerase [Peptococcaceae bacterium CEB3]